jgi:hypothetical protein
MNFQETLSRARVDLRARVGVLAEAALTSVRARANVATKRLELLKGPLATLAEAGVQFRKVAQRHSIQFVQQNASLAAAAGKDVSALARVTYATLAKKRDESAKQPVRKTRDLRKRAKSKAA